MPKPKRLDISMKAQIARLDAVRRIVLKNPNRLQMTNWHSVDLNIKNYWTGSMSPRQARSCNTAHCLGGWLQALCPNKNIRNKGAEGAAAELVPDILPDWMLYVSDLEALEWLEDREYAK